MTASIWGWHDNNWARKHTISHSGCLILHIVNIDQVCLKLGLILGELLRACHQPSANPEGVNIAPIALYQTIPMHLGCIPLHAPSC